MFIIDQIWWLKVDSRQEMMGMEDGYSGGSRCDMWKKGYRQGHGLPVRTESRSVSYMVLKNPFVFYHSSPQSELN
jgi:hypothetical protein